MRGCWPRGSRAGRRRRSAESISPRNSARLDPWPQRCSFGDIRECQGEISLVLQGPDRDYDVCWDQTLEIGGVDVMRRSSISEIEGPRIYQNFSRGFVYERVGIIEPWECVVLGTFEAGFRLGGHCGYI